MPSLSVPSGRRATMHLKLRPLSRRATRAQIASGEFPKLEAPHRDHDLAGRHTELFARPPAAKALPNNVRRNRPSTSWPSASWGEDIAEHIIEIGRRLASTYRKANGVIGSSVLSIPYQGGQK